MVLSLDSASYDVHAPGGGIAHTVELGLGLGVADGGGIDGGVSNPTDRPFALDGLMFADNALPGRLAFAILSLLVRASARKALMKSFHGTL
jgi:hypothetical protein